MRIIDYSKTVLGDIRTQPVRSGLTISAIVISSALFLALVSLGIHTRSAIVGHITSGDTLSTVIVSNSGSAGSGLFTTSVQVARSQSQKIDDSTVQTIAALPHVTQATPQAAVWQIANFHIENTSKQFVANTIATSSASQGSTQLIAGSWFDNTSREPQVVLGNSYLRALGITDPQSLINTPITFTTIKGYRGVGADIPTWNATESMRQQFATQTTTLTGRIVGITSPSARDNQLYIPLEWARQVEAVRVSTPTGETSEDIFAKNGYSTILVKANDQQQVASVAQSIENLGFGTTTYQKQIDQINQLSVVMWIVLGAVAIISLISASLGIVNTLLMALSEQKITIQIWRACGANRGLIARLYLLQAMFMGAIGGSIGALIGWFVTAQLNQRIAQVLSSQGLEAIAIPPVSATMVIGTIALATALSAIAAIVPAHKASRLS